jgi:hypothetical protein
MHDYQILVEAYKIKHGIKDDDEPEITDRIQTHEDLDEFYEQFK